MLHFVDTDTRSVPGSLRALQSSYISMGHWEPFEYTFTRSPLPSPLVCSACLYPSFLSRLVPEETCRSGESERDKRRVQGSCAAVSYSRFPPYPGAFVVWLCGNPVCV